MERKKYSYEDAFEHAEKEAIRTGHDMLVVQRIGPEHADTYDVFAEEAYIRWPLQHRDDYITVGDADGMGRVRKHTQERARQPSFKEFLAERYEIKVDGYTLRHEYEDEEDNRKIWHFATAPGGKETTLYHTPYQYIDEEDFAKYVAYHKKHGQWPGGSREGNWSKDTLHKLETM